MNKYIYQRFIIDNYNAHHCWCIGENIQFDGSTFKCDLLKISSKSQNPQIKPSGLELQIYCIATGGIRIRVEPTEKEKYARYDVSKEDLLISQSTLNMHVNINVINAKDSSEIILTFSQNLSLVLQKNPLIITLKENDKSTVIMNSNYQLIFEHGNLPVSNIMNIFDLNDPIPNGACAVGLDFVFSSKEAQISGLAEMPSSVSIDDTDPSVPFRLFNSGVNIYDVENPKHLYGTVPFLICHSPTISCGLFWMNSSDTIVSIHTKDEGREISFLSETGFVDFVLFSGSFSDILNSYTSLTGSPFMPPLFSFGYHQCRWGYKSQDQVESVMKGLDDSNIPYDSIWLDIDHLKKYMPFVVDTKKFPHMNKLCIELDKNKRHLVRILNPNLPAQKTHKQFCECISNPGFYMNNPNGKPYCGVGRPGTCIWPDFLNPECRKWYSSQFSNVGKDQTEIIPLNVHFWNDINEPTIYKTSHYTFPKSVVHFDGTETRSTHNIYGTLNSASTYAGCKENRRRPFVLTRSFWAGVQRYAFVWTGDNFATKPHMNVSIDMVLSLGLCGIPFTGADIGGFFNSPEDIFIAHWMRLACYIYPFFREHCCIRSKNREPFLFHGKAFTIAKQSICDRYKLISFWYTQGYKAHLTGIPIIKPLWAVFPSIDSYHGKGSIDDVGPAVVVGDSLLVNFKKKQLPPGRWFYLWNGMEKKQSIPQIKKHSSHNDESEEEEEDYDDESGGENGENKKKRFIESDNFVLLRGGKIIPVHDEIDKSAELTVKKPLTIVVALDENNTAEGELFMDDGSSFDFNDNPKKCIHRLFKYENGVFTSKSLIVDSQIPEEIADVMIKSIKIYGVNEPSSVDSELNYSYNDNIITINIDNQVGKDFEIKINF